MIAKLIWDYTEELGELVEEGLTPLELSKATELLVKDYDKKLKDLLLEKLNDSFNKSKTMWEFSDNVRAIIKEL